MKNCVLCNNLELHRLRVSSLLNQINFKIDQKNLDFLIIKKSPNFSVTLDAHPLCANHFLIYSKKHIPSFSEAISDDKTKQEEVKNLILFLSKKIGSSKLIFFEHGEGIFATKKGGNTISHAHLHVIVGKGGINLIRGAVKPIKRTCPFLETESFNSDGFLFPKKILAGFPYLLIGNLANRWIFIDKVRLKIPSQILRKVFGEIIQKEKEILWDWKNLSISEKKKVTGWIRETIGNLYDQSITKG